ncbi:hypothetical protein HH303_18635 [Rhodospirillaceae bacterium KN72]|uniref:Uncharacterized protein n=1 Tax=Pacificispira spongiicola TaxID=2729598 RepID=A0A7Y0E3E5_9PROT|nr:hypothetical protein [Pacificispira spongiicola]NMM46515.1 hypothetical protein [Pacificispira spongiicola]
MVSALNVTAEQIHGIKSSEQLVRLLRRLLHAEARANNIARRGINVPAQITVSDKGEDARIEWRGGPNDTDYLPARVSMFQSKATRMTDGKCKSEVKNKDGTLKEAIGESLEANGAYIIFCTDKYVGDTLRERVNAVREGIATASANKYPDALIEFYDANKISDWVNSHPSVAIWALAELFGRPVTGLQSWKSWCENPDLEANTYEFIPGRSADGLVDLNNVIRDVPLHLASPRAVARIVGLSGLGKTRVALEMFRPPDEGTNTMREAEVASIVYASTDIGAENLSLLFNHFRNENVDGIVIVDDCDIELHHNLARVAQHPDSHFSLLTLDFDPKSVSGDARVVELRRFDNDTIKSILKQAYPGLRDPDIDRICAFAQGFPLMAVLLGKAALSDIDEVVTLKDDVVLKRMIWGRDEPDAQGHSVIAACSLFDNLGVYGPSKRELEFVAQSICNTSFSDCFQWVQRFERRQLIQRRGDFVQVLPKPLALRLAGERWAEIHPDDAKSWFGGAMPERLQAMLCDQLAKLDFHPSAKALVEELCGPTGPFSDPEVLNTEAGSRCFRSLVETNPQAALNGIEIAYGSWTPEQLLNVVDGRRNLIWALEKLCFRRETFHSAATLLLAFAAAENESWSNNATGQFVHLYQLVLSGTEANGDEKLLVIDEALSSNDPRYLEIAVQALGHGLTLWHYSRTGGAEEQGSGKRLQDWYPTRDDADRYIRNILSRLTDIACGHTDFAEKAKNEIATRIRELVSRGFVDEVSSSVESIVERHGIHWPTALEQTYDVLQFDAEGMVPELRKKAESLHNRLLPRSLEDRLRFYVTDLPWDFILDDDGQKDVDNEIKTLANECSQNVDLTLKLLPAWLVGSHRQFFAFGRHLGENFPEPERLVGEALTFLENTDDQETSASFLGAFLAGIHPINPALAEQTLDTVSESPKLQHFLVDLTRFMPIGVREIRRIVSKIESGGVSPSEAQLLAYGSVLADLAPEEITPLLEALSQLDGDGHWTALFIATMYLHGDRKGRFHALREQVENLLRLPDLLTGEHRSTSDDHHFEVLATLALNGAPSTKDLAQYLAAEIIRLCKRKSFSYGRDHLVGKLMNLLFANYQKDVWPLFKAAIAEDDPLAHFHLEHVLGAGFDKGEGKIGVLLSLSNDVLLEWCREEPQSAPAFLAKIAPLLEQNGEELDFTPLMAAVLEEFGDRKDVLSAVSGNMYTFFHAGSLVPYFQQYVRPMEQLLSHRHKAVREFAKRQIASLRSNIESEKKQDEANDFGIF